MLQLMLQEFVHGRELHQVEFPIGGPWDELKRQLLIYRLDDKKLEQDAVMALAIAVRHALRNPEKGVENPTFTYFGVSD